MATELGIGGEFIPMISHAIREQIVMSRLKFNQNLLCDEFVRPLRMPQEDEWEPELYMIPDDEIIEEKEGGRLLR